MKFRHNKKRNTGLIYELLIRNLSVGFLEDNSSTVDSTLSLIRKHFSPNSCLSEEVNLFSILLNNDVNNKRVANKIFGEVSKYASKLDWKKLEREKTHLAKDIRENLSSDFYNMAVPKYKLYASVQQLLNLYKGIDSSINSNIKKIKLEESLIEHLITNKPKKEELQEAQQKLDQLTLRLFIEGYNEKYKDIFTTRQSKLIKRMVEDNDENFFTYLDTFVEGLDKEIKTSVDSKIIKENDMLRVKYNKITEKWNKDKVSIIEGRDNEESLTMLMRYVGLMDNIREK